MRLDTVPTTTPSVVSLSSNGRKGMTVFAVSLSGINRCQGRFGAEDVLTIGGNHQMFRVDAEGDITEVIGYLDTSACGAYAFEQ